METLPTRLRDHWWWRPGCRLGRRAYSFHITSDGDTVDHADQLRRPVHDYQVLLSGIDGLDLVPHEWLHLTMQNIGFTDEVGAEAVQSVAWQARTHVAHLMAFDLTFGPAHVRREAVALQPHPSEPVIALRHALTLAIAEVLGEDAVPVARILGHSSVTTTVTIYAHALEEQTSSRAAQVMDEALRGTSG